MYVTVKDEYGDGGFIRIYTERIQVCAICLFFTFIVVADCGLFIYYVIVLHVAIVTVCIYATMMNFITAQCTLVHLRGLAIACRLSVHLSVRL